MRNSGVRTDEKFRHAGGKDPFSSFPRLLHHLHIQNSRRQPANVPTGFLSLFK